MRVLLSLALCAGIVGISPHARADVSTWLFVGAGPSWIDQGNQEQQLSFQLDAGLGSPATHPVVVGGLFHLQSHFGLGTDLGLMGRIATQGFANGDWGGAVDLGAYQRWWGMGSTGGRAALALGAPWGITLNLAGQLGTRDNRMLSAVLGIDLARLTVHRQSGLDWWHNPFPADHASL